MSDEEFEVMLTQLEPKLRIIAKGYLHCYADQQDAMQECFYRVWLNRDTLIHAEYFTAWAIRIMKNVCISAKRKLNSASHCSISDDTPCKDSALEDLLEYDALYAALGKAKEEDRQLIHLRYFEGYRIKEISMMTKQPMGTVLSKVYRSLKRMRRYLSA